MQGKNRLSLPQIPISGEFDRRPSLLGKSFSPVSNLHRNVRVDCCCCCVGDCVAGGSIHIVVVVVVVVVVVCVDEAAHETRWLRWGPIHPGDVNRESLEGYYD